MVFPVVTLADIAFGLGYLFRGHLRTDLFDFFGDVQTVLLGGENKEIGDQ